MERSSKSALEALWQRLGEPGAPPAPWASLLDLAWTWGQRTNLTAAKDRGSLCEVLFVDAWHLWKAEVVSEGSGLVDVGAGVGAPTLPLLIARPDLTAVLVEPRRKRVAFLRHVVGMLKLERRVEVRETRVDPNQVMLKGTPFDVALSRATFDPADWLRIGSQLGTQVLVFLASREAPSLDGWTITQRLDYRMPSTDAPRSIVRYSR